MMKFAVLVAIFGLLNAFEFDKLSIPEDKEMVDESIVLDRERGLQTYHTGDHLDRKGVTELIDSELELVANKFDQKDGDRSEKICILMKYNAKVDLNPNQASRALKMTNKKMPSDVEEIQHNYILEPFEQPGKLPKHFKRFCRGLKIVRQKIVKDMKEANEAALKEALAAKKNSRKRAILREFTACTNASTMKIMTCPGDKLRAECRIRRSSCTYKISCPMDLNKGGFNCRGLHKLNSMVCCDYNC